MPRRTTRARMAARSKMTNRALTTRPGGELAAGELLAAFAAFLGLNVAEGDASPEKGGVHV